MQLNAYGTKAILITYVHLKHPIIMTSMQVPEIAINLEYIWYNRLKCVPVSSQWSLSWCLHITGLCKACQLLFYAHGWIHKLLKYHCWSVTSQLIANIHQITGPDS